MGNSHSKKTRISSSSCLRHSAGVSNRVICNFESQVSDLTLTESDDTAVLNESPDLNIDAAKRWEDKLFADPKNRLALAALTTHAATAVLQNPTARLHDSHIFSDKIDLEGAPVTNQRSSGRCWLFASTNVFRIGIMRKYKLASLELSQSYLFFWDKLEKANFFLEQIIDTLDEPLDGRLVQYLLHDPVGDGGQWDMVVNLVEKYGLIPQTIYPDSYNAKASGRINWLITAKLREAALTLRQLANNKGFEKSQELQRLKAKVIEEIYGVLVLALGPPPKPDETFVWSFTDKDNKYHSETKTPLEFYKDNVGSVAFPAAVTLGFSVKGSVKDRISLVNDPRNDYMRLLTVDRLGNVYNGRSIQYVNVDMITMKTAIIGMLKANIPVFFGCDVGKFSDTAQGIMDTALFDYTLGFNVTLGMDKAGRLRTCESSMTHAMVLSGVHLITHPDGTVTPQRWRVENSWGEGSGEKGYQVMTDDWMDQYCYQAVVDPCFVSAEVKNVLKQDPLVLPIWDPMGSLA